MCKTKQDMHYLTWDKNCVRQSETCKGGRGHAFGVGGVVLRMKNAWGCYISNVYISNVYISNVYISMFHRIYFLGSWNTFNFSGSWNVHFIFNLTFIRCETHVDNWTYGILSYYFCSIKFIIFMQEKLENDIISFHSSFFCNITSIPILYNTGSYLCFS